MTLNVIDSYNIHINIPNDHQSTDSLLKSLVFYSMTETRPPHFGWKAEYLKLSKEVEQLNPIPRCFALPKGASQIRSNTKSCFALQELTFQKITRLLLERFRSPLGALLKKEPRLFQLPQLPQLHECNTS